MTLREHLVESAVGLSTGCGFGAFVLFLVTKTSLESLAEIAGLSFLLAIALAVAHIAFDQE